MKKIPMLVLLAAFLSLPAGVMASDLLGLIPLRLPKERPVPEPATMLLVGAAGAGLAIARKLRSKK